jgi:hypothetical protein
VLGINLEEEAEGLIDIKNGLNPDEVNFTQNDLVFIVANVATAYATEYLAGKGLRIDTDIKSNYCLFELVLRKIFSPSVSLRNKHRSERCFIVCNGPSIEMDDLDKIAESNIVSFGTNYIYKIFSQTAWRPDYYTLSDTILIRQLGEIDKTVTCPKFINLDGAVLADGIEYDNAYFYSTNLKEIYLMNTIKPSVGTEMHNLSAGFTVCFYMLQIAFYLGFKEIYIIGCDNTSYHQSAKHIYDNNNSKKIFTVTDFSNEMNLQFSAARDYAEKNGIEIYNATRGGELEVFERIDFDEIQF